MQTYIKTEEVEKFVFSLIMDSRNLKSALKKMNRNMKEEDEFIQRIVRGNLEILTQEDICLQSINTSSKNS